MAQEPGSQAFTLTSDAGQVVNWLVKVVVGLFLAGLVVFEVGAAVIVKATAADTASKAATEAGFTYRDSASRERAEQEAKAIAEREGSELVSFEVNLQNRTTTVTVRKTAKTLFIHKIDQLKKYTTVTATQSAPFPT